MIDFRRTSIALGDRAPRYRRGRAGAPWQSRRPRAKSRPGQSNRQEQAGPGVLSLLPGDAVTEHSIDVPGGKLAYTATAGTFSLFDQSGERSAAIFYTAYVAKSNDPADR